jgi:hypothetical protein
VVYRPTSTEVRQQWIVHLARSKVSSSSSLSSSSESGQDIQNLIREKREAENLYSGTMLDVGWLEPCLDVLK